MNIKTYKSYAKNKEFAEFVEKWLDGVEWTREEMWKNLENEGIKMPIQIREFDKEKKSFKTFSKQGEDVEIIFDISSIMIKKIQK